MSEIIVWNRPDSNKLETIIKKAGRRLFKIMGIENARLDVFILPDKEMKAIKNKLLPSNTGPADVLAFPEPEKFSYPPGPRPLGEIYINRDLITKDYGRLIFLLIHGFLHLLGFDHSLKSDILKMEKLEKRLWDQISSLV